MKYRQKFVRAVWISGFFCLTLVTLQPAVLAQSLDSESIDRIRKRINPAPEDSVAGEPDPLREDVSAAIVALTQRLDALERDNADLKAKVKSLEARLSASPSLPSNDPIQRQESQPQPPGSSGRQIRSGERLRMLVDECVTGCTISDLEKLRFVTVYAKPGSVITIAPGVYKGYKSLTLNGVQGDDKSAPVTLRAERLGTVKVEATGLVALRVTGPNWVIENLDIVGGCAEQTECEHAFQIGAEASRTVLRNNRMREFNSAIKAGGNDAGVFPRDVLIEGNHIFNSTVRQTSKPVTQVDVNGGKRWKVIDNFIADFGKAGGNQTSYAGFLKSNSSDGEFSRNLVICEWKHKGGERLGLSFGGGGTTDPNVCENKDCSVFHTNGLMANNIIMNCPDVGIYLNRSKATKIYNNTLIGTLGIDARFEQTTATIENNVVFQRIKERDGGAIEGKNNIVDSLFGESVGFANPSELDFSVTSGAGLLSNGELPAGVVSDFCGNPRKPGASTIGAIAYGSGECNVAARIGRAMQGMEK